MMTKRVLIVGGVAGGASAAARLRRLDESVEIVLFDRGPYVSFANCGLPYHVGNVIAEERALLLASSALFRERFNIDVQTEHEVLHIDRAEATIRVRDVKSGKERDERWDHLVLAPGAAPLVPPVEGCDLEGVFVVRTIPDTRRIRAFLEQTRRKTAVIVGAGFIGLEMAENLARRGLLVTLLEKQAQILPPLDPEMAASVASHLREAGIALRTGQGLARIAPEADHLRVETDLGRSYPADLVILALGVRPEAELAKNAGLGIGARGGIVVDEQQRTSDPRILAVGDAVEVRDTVSGQELILPLAGPANRQGRVAAETIARGTARFRGVQATAIVGLFGLSVATTGANEKGLQRLGRHDYHVIYLHPGHHASYYPGAKRLHMKLIFDYEGRILGAQAVGVDGVDKRIDVIATALKLGGSVFDLAELELCYAPQFGSAKDPTNVAGMIAVNVLRGDMRLADFASIGTERQLLLDVRERKEYENAHIEGALNIPLSELRVRAGELPRDRPILVYCAVGQRGYFAQRFLSQNGYDARNLSGGFTTFKAFADARARAEDSSRERAESRHVD